MSGTKKEISVRVADVLAEMLKDKCKVNFISRDGFLSSILDKEADKLYDVIKNKEFNRHTDSARKSIERLWRNTKKVTLNLRVSQDCFVTLERLKHEHNVVRDAFINRILLFLVAPDKLLTELDVFSEERHVRVPLSPLLAIEEVLTDPFFELESQLKEQGGMYGVDIPTIKNLPEPAAFHCLPNFSESINVKPTDFDLPSNGD